MASKTSKARQLPEDTNTRQKNDGGTKYFDYSLLFLVIFLVGFGLVMLYSVSSSDLKTQAIAAAGGFVLMIIVSFIPYKFWQKTSLLWYLLSLALVLAVFVVGVSSNGSTRWLNIGGFSFQPSEAVKLTAIIYTAAMLTKVPRHIGNIKTLIKVIIRLVPAVAAIAVTNLSTAIIVAAICFVMIFVSSPKYKQFIILVAAGAAAVAIGIMVAGYRTDRINGWLHPEDYPADSYQVLQGLYAIGSGGLFGKGLGSSLQKLGSVPEAQNDFIFTIICEELGLFGAICVILLFVLLIWRFMVIANNAPDLYSGLVVVGVMAHIAVQVVLNIAVVTNTIPSTGVTLPFISSGGSAMLILLVEMGLVLNISRGIKLDAG